MLWLRRKPARERRSCSASASGPVISVTTLRSIRPVTYGQGGRGVEELWPARRLVGHLPGYPAAEPQGGGTESGTASARTTATPLTMSCRQRARRVNRAASSQTAPAH